MCRSMTGSEGDVRIEGGRMVGVCGAELKEDRTIEKKRWLR